MNISAMLFGLFKKELGDVVSSKNVHVRTSVCLKYAILSERMENTDDEYELKVLMVDQIIPISFQDDSEGWCCESFTDKEFVSISDKDELQIHNPDIVHFRHEFEIKLTPKIEDGKLGFIFEYAELEFEQLVPMVLDSSIYWVSAKD